MVSERLALTNPFLRRSSSGRFWMISSLSLLFLAILPTPAHSYSNVTLKSDDLSVTIYLPQSVKPDEMPYYQSSRFEHGSMIGSILRREKNTMLYGTNVWRVPHNPGWTESGVGLASEFGVGDNGAFCSFQCGWYGVSDVSNGVLGYIQAKNGEPFLKIGVGVLEKGSCYECDSSEDYKFNSPYTFAEPPVWTMEQLDNSVTLQQESVLHAKRFYGYRLKKQIELEDDTLTVTTTLTNLGQDAFTTTWYSHHFFSCNDRFIGQGYSVDLDTTPSTKQIFEEPSLWSWSSPLRDYATVTAETDSVHVEMERHVDSGVKIKAEFPRDDTSDGSFTLHGCGTSIRETIPQVALGGNANSNTIPMYAFNLYVEQGTLSPEPQYLIHLEPGRSISWQQVLQFSDDDNDNGSGTTPMLQAAVVPPNGNNKLWHQLHLGTHNHISWTTMLFVSCICLSLLYHLKRPRNDSHSNYAAIPDVPLPQQLQHHQEEP